MTNPAPPLDVPPRVLEFLGDQTTLTLATASPSGIPRATDLRYTSDGLTIYVWMRSQSWTAKQLEQNPLVGFTISEENAALQGSGEARVVLSGDEVAKAVELFSSKFPTALGASTMNISFFRIAPTDVTQLIARIDDAGGSSPAMISPFTTHGSLAGPSSFRLAQ